MGGLLEKGWLLMDDSDGLSLSRIIVKPGNFRQLLRSVLKSDKATKVVLSRYGWIYGLVHFFFRVYEARLRLGI